MTQRWAIVGGGILGLDLARRLASTDRHITLYEAAPTVGGLASAWQVGPITWDRFYHVVLRSDANTRAMLERLGLGDDITWAKPRTGLFANGSVRPLNGPADYLRIPGLSMIDKARLGATLALGAKLGSLDRLESVPIDAWLRKWSGKRAYERLWDPLLRAKLGDASGRASAAFICATARRLSKARKGGVSGDEFGIVKGGYARVLEALARELHGMNIDVRTSAPVASIEREGDAFTVRSNDAESQFDRVVMATPPGVLASACPGLTHAERDALAGVEYQGVVCVSLVLDKPLTPNYLTYVTTPGLPITTVIDMTAVAGEVQFAGRGLVYLPRYTNGADPIFQLPDDEIVRTFADAAAQLYPDLRNREVIAAKVARAREVFALPVLDYTRKLPSATTSIPGLTIASSAWIPFAPLNVDETLRFAESCARELVHSGGMRSVAQGNR